MPRTIKEKRAIPRYTFDVSEYQRYKETLPKGFHAQPGISQAWRQSNDIFRQKHLRKFISYTSFLLKVFGDTPRKTQGRIRRIFCGLGVCGSNPEPW